MLRTNVDLFYDGTVSIRYGSGLRLYEYSMLDGSIINEAYLLKYEELEPGSIDDKAIKSSLNHDLYGVKSFTEFIEEIFNKFTNQDNGDENNERFFDRFIIRKTDHYLPEDKYDYEFNVSHIDFIQIVNNDLGYEGYLIFLPFNHDKLFCDDVYRILSQHEYRFDVCSKNPRDLHLAMKNYLKEINCKYFDAFEIIDRSKHFGVIKKSDVIYESQFKIGFIYVTILSRKKLDNNDDVRDRLFFILDDSRYDTMSIIELQIKKILNNYDVIDVIIED